MLYGKKLDKRIDWVAYTLEEPPFFRTEHVGSAVHARSLVDNIIKIMGMICLEMIGYFSDTEGSQDYPISSLKALYPARGNYITVAGKTGGGKLSEEKKN